MGNYKKDIQLMKDLLSTKPNSIVKNLEIITPDDIGTDHMLHISLDTAIKKFIPYMPTSAGDGEDRSFPRICVSSSLLCCILGLTALEYNFIEMPKYGDELRSKIYKGGYYIYGLKYNAALKPNKKLVWDSEMTNEYWLTNYSPETAEYKPSVLGKFYVSSMVYSAQGNLPPNMIAELYIEVTTDVPIKFDEKNTCSKGYYRVQMNDPSKIKNYKTVKDILAFHPVSKEEYLSSKKISAALLSCPSIVSNWN